MERVFEVLQPEIHIRDPRDGTELPCQPRELKLQDISFSYANGRQVLDRVNVTIEPGQTVAFAGSSGVGKSKLRMRSSRAV